MVGQRRYRQFDPLARIMLALPVERLMVGVLVTSIIANRLGPAKPRAMAWNGAGGCAIYGAANGGYAPPRTDIPDDVPWSCRFSPHQFPGL